MKIEILPNYSAEKFFLLSELEQKCSISCLETNSNERFLKEDCIMTFFYSLWNLSQSSSIDQINSAQTSSPKTADEIIRIILGMVDRVKEWPRFDPKTAVIVLDVLIHNQQQFYETKFRDEIENVLKQLKDQTLFPLILIGVCEHSACSPGLEKCYDLIERILPGYSEIHQIANLITESPQVLLGHDEGNHEPDAISNIFQALCSTDDQAENEFLLSLFEQKKVQIKQHLRDNEDKVWSQKKYKRETKEGEDGDQDEKEYSKKQSAARSSVDFYIEAIGCAVIAAFIYYFLLRHHVINSFL